MKRALKVLISVAVVFHLLAIVLMNLPPDTNQRIEAAFDNPYTLYRYQYFKWIMHTYAHAVGVDNRWEMFSILPRFNWNLRFNGIYKGGEKIVLPLPRQSPRGFWQSTFADFKEAKFHLNIYGAPESRRPYLLYLCRAYPRLGDQPIEAIEVERSFRTILPRDEALKKGTAYGDQQYTTPLEKVPCG